MSKKETIFRIILAFKNSPNRWNTVKAISQRIDLNQKTILRLINNSDKFIKANKSNIEGESLFALREKKSLSSTSFIFQSIPERYDLRQKLVPQTQDTWYATRYRNKMEEGDIVFFWMAGDRRFRGLHGWGKLISKPYLKNNWDTYGIDVEYLVKFKKPITSSLVQKNEELSNLLIFRAPQATNFILNDSELKKLIKLIESLKEEYPEI